MRVEGDVVIFESTDLRRYANGGIIGISSSGHTFGGYDGELFAPEDLTREERIELADYMIARWTMFREGL